MNGPHIGEIRALEGEHDPERRRALVARLLTELSEEELACAVLEMDDRVKSKLALEVIRTSDMPCWTNVVGAHHESHEIAREGMPCPNCGETLTGTWSITSIDEDYNWDEGNVYTFTDCGECGRVYRCVE